MYYVSSLSWLAHKNNCIVLGLNIICFKLRGLYSLNTIKYLQLLEQALCIKTCIVRASTANQVHILYMHDLIFVLIKALQFCTKFLFKNSFWEAWGSSYGLRLFMNFFFKKSLKRRTGMLFEIHFFKEANSLLNGLSHVLSQMKHYDLLLIDLDVLIGIVCKAKYLRRHKDLIISKADKNWATISCTNELWRKVLMHDY